MSNSCSDPKSPCSEVLPADSTHVSPVIPLALTTLAATLTACGGGGSNAGTETPLTPVPPPTQETITPVQASRFLQQASLSVDDAAITQVVSLGYSGWLEAQFTAPRTQSRWDWMLSQGYQNSAQNANSFAGADNSLWNKLIAATDPLRQRIALALSEILVVSMAGLNVAWRGFCIAAYADLLEDHAFGNYRTLLGAVTLSTGMGNYLNMRGNQKEDPKTGRQPDENYAREILQLFSIGLYLLNNDGSLKLDTSGKPIETYTQDSISGLAKVFTGWDYTGYTSSSPDFHRQPMSFVASRFSTSDKSFLGSTIQGSVAGPDALNMALDKIFSHPNVGPFIGRQLIQRLVTSNPSPAYIGRVAAVFNNNGVGVRGDLKAVIRAILLDSEARSAPVSQATGWGKLREPMLRFVQWARTFGATSPTGIWNIGDTSDPNTRLGQSPMRSPTVFNYFRPGYIPPNTSLATAGMVSPELQISNESSVVAYLNYLQNVIASGVGEVKPDYTGWLALVDNPAVLMDKINLMLAAGQLSATTMASIVSAVGTISITTATGRLNRVRAAILLTMASPEYLVFK
jgi:uncharacterized protein (DUF1800 family)